MALVIFVFNVRENLLYWIIPAGILFLILVLILSYHSYKNTLRKCGINPYFNEAWDNSLNLFKLGIFDSLFDNYLIVKSTIAIAEEYTFFKQFHNSHDGILLETKHAKSNFLYHIYNAEYALLIGIIPAIILGVIVEIIFLIKTSDEVLVNFWFITFLVILFLIYHLLEIAFLTKARKILLKSQVTK